MNNFLLNIYFRLISLVRTVTYPIFVYFISAFVPFVSRRVNFEKKNRGKESISFNLIGQEAFIAFECSSEGELEQIRPVVDMLLNRGELVELIFSSESVEGKCLDLYNSYFDNLRILRLPLLTYNCFTDISKWITAKRLILVRYDFFPELLMAGKDREFVLLSASLKGKDAVIGSIFGRLYLRTIYSLFDYIVASSKAEMDRIIGLGISHNIVDYYDFRVDRILSRLSCAKNYLEQRDFWPFFNSVLDRYSKSQRVIIGSCWPAELDILTDQFIERLVSRELLLVIAPHKLSSTFCDELIDIIKLKVGNRVGIKVVNSNFKDTGTEDGRFIYIVTVPGILVELYSLFGVSFIGGGFGRSIHSVLEPFLAGCTIHIGPKIYRSTEYDLVKEIAPDRIKVLDNAKKFSSEMLLSSQFDISKFVSNGKSAIIFKKIGGQSVK